MDLAGIGLITLMALQGVPAGGRKDRAPASCVISRTVEETLASPENREFHFSANAAQLTVTGSEEQTEVVLKARICVASEDLPGSVRLEASTGPNGGLVITARGSPPEEAGANESPVLFILRADVPPSLEVSVRNAWGRTTVTGVSSTTVEMGRGDVRLGSISGSAVVRLDRGDVHAAQIDDNLDVARETGELRVDEVGGSVTLTATGIGESEVRNVAGDVHVRSDGPGDMSPVGGMPDWNGCSIIDGPLTAGVTSLRGRTLPVRGGR